MNSLITQTMFLDAVTGAAQFAVNWLLQSTLLISVGLVVGALAKSRGSAVQSAVYRTTLVAVLVCPLATWLLARAGVSGWSVTLPVAWTYAELDPPILAEEEVSAAVSPPLAVAENATLSGETIFPSRVDEFAHRDVPANPSPATIFLPVHETIVPEEPLDVAPAKDIATVITYIRVRSFGKVTLAVALLWCLISVGLLTRLAVAWSRLTGIRRLAAPADPPTIDTCGEVARQLEVATPDVLCSPSLPSPCLAGLNRPAVLLPDEELQLALRDVLIHELAHLRRHDCHWNLLRQLATSIFFFQPMLWLLSRRLETTAEEVCDDFVVQLGGDRQQYAHRLVDIVELSSLHSAAAGVGIVSLRSMLAKRVERIMDTSRSLSTRIGNLLLIAVLAGGLVGTTVVGFVGLGPRTPSADAEMPAAAEEDAASEATEYVSESAQASDAQDDDLITIRGRVVDPDGEPLEGATVRLVRWYWDTHIEHTPLNETHTDETGHFKVTYRKSQFDTNVLRPAQWKEVTVAAFKNGYGPNWVSWDDVPKGDQAHLQLPIDDRPITGHVLDLEGQPLAGIKVSVGGLAAPKGDDLSSWIKAVKQGAPPWIAANHLRGSLPFEGTGLAEELVTDSQGQFLLKGVGRERKIDLVFEGPTIARTSVTVVTRDIAPLAQSLTTSQSFAKDEKLPVLGAEFDLTLPPTRIIEGVVRDAATGDPMQGVAVHSWRFSGTHLIGERQIRSQTDEQGRFRLVGMPKGAANQIVAIPNDEQPYFMRVADVPDEPGMTPITVNIDLHHGIWITGQVTNQATREPVPFAKLFYLPFLTNEYVQALPEFDSNGNVDGTNAYQDRYQTSVDGTYRLVGMPGRAIVGVRAIYGEYRQGLGASDIDGMNESGHFETFRNPVNPSHKWPTAMKEIDPPEGIESIDLDFQLDPGSSIDVATLDPEGKPLTGVTAQGAKSQNEDNIFTATALGPEEVRTILLHHEQRNLGKVIRVRADEELKPLQVRLQRCAKITGRLVDQNHAPVTGAQIRIAVRPAEDFGKELNRISTDADGYFEHASVLPGVNYAVMAESSRTGFSTIAKDLAVQPGETIDLGTIDITSDERPEPMRLMVSTQTAQTTAAPAAELSGTSNYASAPLSGAAITGQVTDATGKPVAGAHVAAIAMRIQPSRGGDFSPSGVVLAQAVTDATGGYTLRFGAISSKTHQLASVIARKDGAAIAWEKFDPDARNVEASFQLVPAELIRGRLINIEGRPATDVRMTVGSVMETSNPRNWDQHGTGYRQFEHELRAWLPAITSDQQGRFVVHGVPAGHGVSLTVEASDQFAPQYISLNSGRPEQRGEDDGTYRSLIKNLKPGEEAVIPLAPAQLFEGTVSFADTEEPAPHARLTIWASQQENYGSMLSLAGKANGEGRYRLSPYPGVRFGLTAYPPDGTPYLPRRTSQEGIRWQAGDRVKRVDMTLPHGVLVRGKLVEQGTGRPVAVASIQYVPQSFDNPHIADDILTGWQAIQISDEAGRFDMAVLPGPGQLMIFNTTGNYVLQEVSERELERGESGGRRKYVHALHKLIPEVGSEPIDATIELKPGAKVIGKIVDEQGQPVDEALVITRLNVSHFSFAWRPHVPPTLGGSFELTGLDPNLKYPVYFLDAQRHLGATAIITANDPTPTVVLKPCGTATATFGDIDDDPDKEVHINLNMVVTPGIERYDMSMRNSRALVADSDFVTNIDRANYWPFPEIDEHGRIELPALIPGATYRIRFSSGELVTSKEFSVQSGEILDFGEIRFESESDVGVEDKEEAASTNVNTLEPIRKLPNNDVGS